MPPVKLSDTPTANPNIRAAYVGLGASKQQSLRSEDIEDIQQDEFYLLPNISWKTLWKMAIR